MNPQLARYYAAVTAVKGRFRAGWEAWVSHEGHVWARMRAGLNGSPRIETEPMTADEDAVVDIVLRDETSNGSTADEG